MTAYRRLLRVSWTTHRTNNTYVLQEIQPQERLLPTVQRRKLQCFGHMVRARNLCTEILDGRAELMGIEDEAGRCEDGQMISRTGRTDQWQSA